MGRAGGVAAARRDPDGGLIVPSYRVAVDVGGVAPGVEPSTVLPRAAEVIGASHLVEDRSVEVVRGRAQVHLRFLVPSGDVADENEEAEAVVHALVEGMAGTAHLGRWRLWRGPGRHWRTVRTGRADEDAPDHPVDF